MKAVKFRVSCKCGIFKFTNVELLKTCVFVFS